MPTIEAIRTLPYDLPLKRPLTWGAGHRLPQLRHVLLRVDLSDGAFGIAEVPPRPSIYGETQATVRHIVEAQLKPLLLGRGLADFQSVAAASARLAHIKNNNCAKGALDMALHQALAQSRGQPLPQYLGLTRARIPLSAIVSTGAADAVLAEVAAGSAAGIRVFKIKIGGDIAANTKKLQRLITRFPQARFYVDANETLTAGQAAAHLTALQRLGTLYCEEPLPTHRLRERAQLRRDCPLPIIADDSAFTLRELQRELAFDTFDVLNIKTARTGFSESRLMLELCAKSGKSAMVGSQASSLLGCLHAALFAGYSAVDCPSECSFYLKTAADLRLAPPIVDGCWELSAVSAALAAVQAALAGLPWQRA